MSIALVLIYLLHRSRTGFKRSDTIIKRLIIFTLSTGLSTSLCAIMTLVTVSLIHSKSFSYMCSYEIEPRLPQYSDLYHILLM